MKKMPRMNVIEKQVAIVIEESIERGIPADQLEAIQGGVGVGFAPMYGVPRPPNGRLPLPHPMPYPVPVRVRCRTPSHFRGRGAGASRRRAGG